MSSGITFSGFNNIDFSVVLNAIMTSESQPLTALQTKQNNIATQVSNFKTLSNYTTNLQTAAAALATSSNVTSYAATATDSSAVSVSSGTGAIAGHYDVVVKELARAQVMASNSTAPDADTTIVATGGALSIGGQSITLPPGLTLKGMADAINANADMPVTAAVIQSGANSFRLVLTAKSTGEANGFQVTSTLTGGGANALTFHDEDGDGISGNSVEDNAVQATDASLLVNNIAVKSASNTVDAAIPGVSLTVFKKDPLATIGVDVAADSSALKTKVTEFINSYNDVVNFATKQATSAANGDSSSIGRDPILRALRNSLRQALSTTYANGGGSEYLSQVGVEFTRTGTISLNSTVFDAAVKNNPSDVATLFSGGNGSAGAFSAISSLLTTYTASSGSLSSMQAQLTAQITRLGDQVRSMQARLAIQRAALQKEFSAADAAMTQLKNQNGSLASFGVSAS